MLRMLGAEVEELPCPFDWMQVPFPLSPKIIFEPGFALTLKDMRSRFAGSIKIGANSTITLGPETYFNEPLVI